MEAQTRQNSIKINIDALSEVIDCGVKWTVLLHIFWSWVGIFIQRRSYWN